MAPWTPFSAPAGDQKTTSEASTAPPAPSGAVPLLFQPPQPSDQSARPSRRRSTRAAGASFDSNEAGSDIADDESIAPPSEPDQSAPDEAAHETTTSSSSRRRRSRGGRNRRKSGSDADAADLSSVAGTSTDTGTAAAGVAGAAGPGAPDASPEDSTDLGESVEPLPVADSPSSPSDNRTPIDTDDESSSSSRRRRRRRRSGDDAADTGDADSATVVRVREKRTKKETISSVEGSTRIEAKKQRRREGREAGRRRPPILSESEFLARRESVERVMVIRQRADTTQIAVLEDSVLVEHYVALESQTSLIGNVYLGRVQNVLPSMEAAFVDIGKGRNAVLYAGEVNWSLIGDSHKPRKIEHALKPGQSILVQVTKDPVGHKGARLTSQINLPGRYLVYVHAGGTSGISRKLPDTERNRLKKLLKDILPEDAGVIVRTAAEGASEDELTRDVARLTARWDDIDKKTKGGQAPLALYTEPETTLKVVRDLFTEDFVKLVISGDDAWDMVDGYVQHVAPDLAERLERYAGDGDVFQSYRVDEQIAKALDRKVWLPSGGSLVIDRTEAMTVVDVNTGKFTGAGGNLEETVTKNNLEAAEEIVRQLRLRDIGGIIVVDFIDMVLEHNRDLVLTRLVECLSRDRTRHQVAEVTSLGLVQMTRKRISSGLLEVFSHNCEVCQGRGVVIEDAPVESHRVESHRGESRSDSASRRTPSSPKIETAASNGSPAATPAKRSGRRRSSRRADGPGDEGLAPSNDRPNDRPSDHPESPDSPTTADLQPLQPVSPADPVPASL